MEIIGAGIGDIGLIRDAVRHTRLDIEDFLENGALAETEPEYQNELAFYQELRDKHDRLAETEALDRMIGDLLLKDAMLYGTDNQ